MVLLAPFSVYSQPASAIDGSISRQEWRAGKHVSLSNGDSVSYFQDPVNLYIAIKSKKASICNIFVSDGDSVYVLHRSMSQGQVSYFQNSDKWNTQQKFVWRLNDVNNYVNQLPDAFKQHHWIASHINGSKEGSTEFLIQRKFRVKELNRLAIVYAPSPMSPATFPAVLADDCKDLNFIFGAIPPSVKFEIEKWIKF
jgi:hypothetical protein